MRRKKIEEIAGDSFVDAESISTRIPYLAQFSDEQFLFGIYQSRDVWTVLSVRYLFASYGGAPFRLQINERSREVHEYVGRAGTKHVSDVVLADGASVWMKSVAMSCLFQNMLLMLEKLPDEAVLKD